MRSILLLGNLFFLFSYFSNGQVAFIKAIGGSENDHASYVQNTSDDAFIISGGIGSSGAGSYDKWLIKIDKNGDTLWTKTYGDNTLDEGLRVKQSFDGGFAIFGAGGTSWTATIVKVDSIGDLQWAKTYGDGYSNYCYSLQNTSDSGYVFTGFIIDSITGIKEMYLVKTNSIGDTVWTRAFGDSLDDVWGFSLQQTYDGGFIVSGISGGDAVLVKTNFFGDTIWTKKYIVINNDYGSQVEQCRDSGFIVAGSNNGDIYLLKTDKNGNFLWRKTYGGSGQDVAASIIQTKDGGYLFSGDLYVPIINQYSAYLIKTNSFGDTLWTNAIGDSVNSSYAIQSLDSGFVIVGTCVGCGSGKEDAFIAKTDSLGRVGCLYRSTGTNLGSSIVQTSPTNFFISFINNPILIPATSVSSGANMTTICSSVSISEFDRAISSVILSPNPATITLTITSPQSSINSVEIYNLLGERIYSKTAVKCGQLTVDCGLFPAGIYFIQIQTDSGTSVQKLIKQ